MSEASEATCRIGLDLVSYVVTCVNHPKSRKLRELVCRYDCVSCPFIECLTNDVFQVGLPMIKT